MGWLRRSTDSRSRVLSFVPSVGRRSDCSTSHNHQTVLHIFLISRPPLRGLIIMVIDALYSLERMRLWNQLDSTLQDSVRTESFSI